MACCKGWHVYDQQFTINHQIYLNVYACDWSKCLKWLKLYTQPNVEWHSPIFKTIRIENTLKTDLHLGEKCLLLRTSIVQRPLDGQTGPYFQGYISCISLAYKLLWQLALASGGWPNSEKPASPCVQILSWPKCEQVNTNAHKSCTLPTYIKKWCYSCTAKIFLVP